MTEDDIHDLRDDFFWRGARGMHHYEMAQRIVDASVADAAVLCHVLRCCEHYFVPAEGEHSREIPPRLYGVQLAHDALALASEVLSRPDAQHDDHYHALWLWVQTLQLLIELQGDDLPSPPVLHSALTHYQTLLNYAQIHALELPWFPFHCAAVRLYVWLLVAVSPDFDSHPHYFKQLASVIDFAFGFERGWLLDPLTRNPAFRDWLSGHLATRSLVLSHPAPDYPGVMLSELATGGDISRENLSVRLQLLCFLGMDSARFVAWAADCIDADLLWGLEVLLSLGFDINQPCPVVGGQTLLYDAVLIENVRAVMLLVAHGADWDIHCDSPDHPGTARSLAEQSQSASLVRIVRGEPGDPAAEAAFAERLRASVTRVDDVKLAMIADMYGGDVSTLSALVDYVLLRLPLTSRDAINAAWLRYSDVFDAMAMILLCRAAGYIDDFVHDGSLVLDLPVMVSGDIRIKGALVDGDAGEFIFAGGSIVADALITEFDCIAGEDIIVRDFIWGNYNDHLLVACGSLDTPLLVLTDHGCCATHTHTGHYVQDPDADTLAELFVAEVMLPDGEGLDRQALTDGLVQDQPVLRAVRQ